MMDYQYDILGATNILMISDSPSRRRIPSCYRPGPGRGVVVELGQRGAHYARIPPVRAVHVSVSNAGMLGDSVRARRQMTL